MDAPAQRTFAGRCNSFARRIFICNSTNDARSVTPLYWPAAKQSVTKTRFRRTAGPGLSPDMTFTLDWRLRRKVAGSRRHQAAVQLFNWIARKPSFASRSDGLGRNGHAWQLTRQGRCLERLSVIKVMRLRPSFLARYIAASAHFNMLSTL